MTFKETQINILEKDIAATKKELAIWRVARDTAKSSIYALADVNASLNGSLVKAQLTNYGNACAAVLSSEIELERFQNRLKEAQAEDTTES